MNKRPRRVFDRSILLARCRWEALRRTAEYRTDTARVIRVGAASLRWPVEKLERYCLDNGGVIEPAWGSGAPPGGLDHYQAVCARYGLVVLIHPDVTVSEGEMAAFPIFADTPSRRPTVKDRGALRRFTRRGMDLSLRTQRRIFAQEQVHAGPFQLNLKRIRLRHFDKILAVFDARRAGKPFGVIAEAVGLSLDQVKRAWETGRRLIPKWLDLESHIATCPTCLACIRKKGDRWCAAAELQIGLPPTGRSRSRTSAERLDLLAARQEGLLPARRSLKRIDSSSDC